MLTSARLTISVLLISAIGSTIGCADPSSDVYLIGTSYPGTAFNALGKALESVVNHAGEVQIAAVETKGSIDNLDQLRTGELDFGLVQGGFVFDDVGLSSVASVDVEYLHIIVPRDSPIREFRDLAGQRVATGEYGTGSLAVVESIVRAAALQPPMSLINQQSRNFSFDGLSADAAMFVTSLRRELTPLLAGNAYRLIPVAQASALAVDMFDVRIAEIPPGVYGPNLSIPPQRLPTLAVDTNIFVRSDVPDVVVRNLTEALFTYHVQSEARLPKLSEVTARDEADLKLHPAAENYYQRNAPLKADQFEIAAFGLAALLTLLSAARWLLQWLRERQLRVDRRAVADILQAISETTFRDSAAVEANRTIPALLLESKRRWLAGQIDDEELRMIFDAASAHGGHSQTAPPKGIAIDSRTPPSSSRESAPSVPSKEP